MCPIAVLAFLIPRRTAMFLCLTASKQASKQVKGGFGMGCGPGCFNQSGFQMLISLGNPGRFFLSGAFVIAWTYPCQGCRVCMCGEYIHVIANLGKYSKPHQNRAGTSFKVRIYSAFFLLSSFFLFIFSCSMSFRSLGLAFATLFLIKSS